MDKLKVRAGMLPYKGAVDLYVMAKDDSAAGVLMLKEKKDGDYIEETACISIEMAQVLMDDLWNIGIRPTEGSGSAGALKATQAHLQDMRNLVFSALREK